MFYSVVLHSCSATFQSFYSGRKATVCSSVHPSFIFNFFRATVCMLSHQNCSSRGPGKVLYLFKQLEIQDGRPGLWLAETFSTTSLYLPEMVL